mgnify:CR=1 FL=1
MPHDEARPLLSLCMIVKNEAEYLETCLKLARPHVDEIVVIDTGSTDGTQDIARRYADVFEEIEWPNSFAAARNYSLDRASGRYILILDGDEYIADPRDWLLLREVLQRSTLTCVRLRIRNLMPPHSFVVADVSFQERIFPNDKSIRYSGKVHNQIVEALKEYQKKTGYPTIDLPIDVIHVGYAHNKEKLQKKYLPRLPLLKEEYETAENEVAKAYYGYQLAAGYFVLKEYDRALEIFEQLNCEALAKGNINNAFYAQMLAAQAALQKRDGKKALLFCNKMLNINRNEPAAYFLCGLALLLERQIENGILFIAESFDINEKNPNARFPVNEEVSLNLLEEILEWLHLNDVKLKLKKVRTGMSRGELKQLLDDIRRMMVLMERRRAAAA